jgi:hypothetical protein
MVRVVAIISVVGIGTVSTAISPQARAAGSGPKVAVYQKLVNFRQQDQIGVQGSGFAANATVTVTLTTTTNGSTSTMSPQSVQTNSHGGFDTGFLQTVSCPVPPAVSYQATANGTSSAVAGSAC